MKKYHDRDWLAFQYYDLRKSTHVIAHECEASHSGVLYYMKKFGLKRRLRIPATREARLGKKNSEESKEKNRIAHLEEKSSRWKGGRQLDRGYVRILKRTHPQKDAKNLIFEHRLVAEQLLGRYLKPREIVHHINGIRNDNRKENLMIFSGKSAHASFHQKERQAIKDAEKIIKGERK